jgi:hypothetical protein
MGFADAINPLCAPRYSVTCMARKTRQAPPQDARALVRTHVAKGPVSGQTDQTLSLSESTNPKKPQVRKAASHQAGGPNAKPPWQKPAETDAKGARFLSAEPTGKKQTAAKRWGAKPASTETSVAKSTAPGTATAKAKGAKASKAALPTTEPAEVGNTVPQLYRQDNSGGLLSGGSQVSSASQVSTKGDGVGSSEESLIEHRNSGELSAVESPGRPEWASRAPEVLAPAGGWPQLRAAVENVCSPARDAVL